MIISIYTVKINFYQQLMKGSYSPYSRSYKFICLQNQLAHNKNKNSVRSIGKSNLSIHNSPKKVFTNEVIKRSSYHSTRPQFNSISGIDDSMFGNRQCSYSFIEPYRVVHKNMALDRKKKVEQYYQNERLAKKLCQVSCSVVTKDKTQKQFQDHMNFRSIARRYGQSGELKQLLKVNQYNSLTASKTKHSISRGNEHCNVSVFRQSNYSSRKKSSKKLLKHPKSNIIRLY